MANSNYIPPNTEATPEEIERFKTVFESLDPIGKARISMFTELTARNDLVTTATIKKMNLGLLTRDNFWKIVNQQYRLLVRGSHGTN